ncbi:MAG: hypothetical protein AAB655_02675 [Patescibacteria group bacterium]
MRRNTNLSLFLLVFLLLIFGLNFFGYRYDWYNTFPWYDIPMHVFGGVWLALALVYIFDGRIFILGEGRKLASFSILLSAVLLIGIFWEIFEYSIDVFIFRKYSFSSVPVYILKNSLSDLINDILGACAVLLIALRSYAKNGPKLSQSPISEN